MIGGTIDERQVNRLHRGWTDYVRVSWGVGEAGRLPRWWSAILTLAYSHASRKSYGAIEIAANDNARAAAQNVVFVASATAHDPGCPGQGKVISHSGRHCLVHPRETTNSQTRRNARRIPYRSACIIPNAPSIVAAGFNPVAFSSTLAESERDVSEAFSVRWASAGDTAEEFLRKHAPATEMHRTTGHCRTNSRSAPGESFGLGRSEAQSAVQHMLSGTVNTMLESGPVPVKFSISHPSSPWWTCNR